MLLLHHTDTRSCLSIKSIDVVDHPCVMLGHSLFVKTHYVRLHNTYLGHPLQYGHQVVCAGEGVASVKGCDAFSAEGCLIVEAVRDRSSQQQMSHTGTLTCLSEIALLSWIVWSQSPQVDVITYCELLTNLAGRRDHALCYGCINREGVAIKSSSLINCADHDH